jgi:hypothetical protein
MAGGDGIATLAEESAGTHLGAPEFNDQSHPNRRNAPMLNRRTILTLLAGSALALPNVALAAAPRVPPGQAGKDNGPGGGKEKHHKDAKSLIGNDIKVNGNHKLDKAGTIDVSADVQGGKVVGFHAKHPSKGDLAVNKVKSTTKFALLERQPASAVQNASVLTVWYYAYWFTDEFGNDWYYWWPVDYIIDDGTWFIYSA